MVGVDAARAGLQHLAGDRDPVGLDRGQPLHQVGTAALVVDRGAEAADLVRRHLVVAARGHQPVRADLDVVRAGGRPAVRLVRGLVVGEPHVAVRTEDLARAELGLQVGQQRQHRRPDVGLVDLALVGPVGLGVVDEQPVVELDGALPEAGERAHRPCSPLRRRSPARRCGRGRERAGGRLGGRAGLASGGGRDRLGAGAGAGALGVGGRLGLGRLCLGAAPARRAGADAELGDRRSAPALRLGRTAGSPRSGRPDRPRRRRLGTRRRVRSPARQPSARAGSRQPAGSALGTGPHPQLGVGRRGSAPAPARAA